MDIDMVHQIVAELHQDVPSALLRVLPQIEDELKVRDAKKRHCARPSV